MVRRVDLYASIAATEGTDVDDRDVDAGVRFRSELARRLEGGSVVRQRISPDDGQPFRFGVHEGDHDGDDGEQQDLSQEYGAGADPDEYKLEF